MRWLWSRLQSKRRRLEVAAGGHWYILFTIVLGVVAIYSGNNVIYLLESLLLAALILSGVLSEWTVARVELRRELGQAEVGREGRDLLFVENRGFLPLYCVELLEWSESGFAPLGFLLLLPARARIRVRSQQALPARGRHHWRGLAVATSFPFGFARKIRLLEEPGSRIVWPARPELGADANLQRGRPRPELEMAVGEVEELPPWEDVSRVHWPSTARSHALLARPVRPIEHDEEIRFRFTRPGLEMERAISGAAARLRRPTQTLWLFRDEQSVRYTGAVQALDALALLPRAGEA